ncbi:MAG: hypothetical protein ACJARZ_000831 [Dokdonia sp.]|jgi:hypothetical protein
MHGCEDPKDVIVGWGDSMMKASLSKTSILDVIEDELNITTYNFGEGGLKSDQVALLQGGLTLYLTPNDSLIGANSELALMPTNIKPFNDFGTQEYDGMIQDMSGRLERIHSPGDGSLLKHYLFKREYSWVEKQVEDTVVFRFDHAQKYKESMTLIWSGRNDDKSRGNREKTVGNIEKMVKVLQGPAKQKYLVLSICNGTRDREGKDTKAHERILNLNEMLNEKFKDHFIDVRSYMVQQAIYDMNISPSPKDLDDMDKDCIPSIFFTDHVHLNELGNTAVGKYIAKVIQEKGWLN